MPRVAIVASHPVQYQAPWFRALAREVDLHVFFCHRQTPGGQAAAGFGRAFDWDVPLLDGYAHDWLANRSPAPGVDRFGGCDTPDVRDRLQAGRFDACIVSGWYLKSYLQAARACWALGIPCLFRGDSQLGGSRLKEMGKFIPYRWFLRRADAHLYVGHANRQYLRHYGVDEARLFHVPHAVDNDRFAAAADDARRSGRAAALRRGWGAETASTVFMFAGKLIPKKRPSDFVRALAALGAAGHDVRGVMVGSGPLQSELQVEAERGGARVVFAGFQNQTAMPDYYAAADAVVLPSDRRETWGLVVNEAMASGLPAIVSDAAGCAADLVVAGRTGFTFALGVVDDLAARMLELRQALATDRASMTAAMAERMVRYSIPAAVRGTLDALSAVATPRPAELLPSR